MKSLVPIMFVLAYVLSGCSPSPSEEELILTLPLAPQATAPRQSGSMLEYSVPMNCSEAESFYETQLFQAGWSLSSSDGSGTSWTRLKFMRERDTAEINLSSSSSDTGKCHVQIFYHKYSSLDTGIPQKVIVITVILVFQGLFGFAGSLASKGKGRHPAIGWLLGFFLGFMGDFFILTWEPRRDLSGRMIPWDEYKLMSKEQREAIRPLSTAPSPEMKRRRLLLYILVIIIAVFAVLEVLRNLGKM